MMNDIGAASISIKEAVLYCTGTVLTQQRLRTVAVVSWGDRSGHSSPSRPNMVESGGDSAVTEWLNGHESTSPPEWSAMKNTHQEVVAPPKLSVLLPTDLLSPHSQWEHQLSPLSRKVDLSINTSCHH